MIFSMPGYLDLLQKINDEVFYLPGVDRNRMRSLWTPNVRWIEVTELGYEGDKVIDSNYDGSERALQQLRQNILRSGEVGRLVANDYRSSIVQAPLIDRDPTTGKPLNYWELSQALETDIRDKYEQLSEDANGQPTVKIHIIGFAKIIGDLLDGITAIFLFAIITLGITSVLLFLYTRSLSATLTPLLCSIIAVIWQLGLLTTLGYGLNAYSILIPFLVFAIGVSHGVQIINAILGESAAGADKLTSARRAFRALYVPGMTALVTDAIGFITMVLIPIQVIKDLGIAASVGVAVIVLTNLVLLPVLMSYFGISKKVAERLPARRAGNKAAIYSWRLLSNFANGKVARVSLVLAAIGFAVGIYGGQNLKIGDLDAGRAGTAPGFPLQPGQPIYHRKLRHQLRHHGHHGRNGATGMHAVQEPGTGGSLHLADGKCAWRKSGHGRHAYFQTGGRGLQRGQPQVGHHQPQPAPAGYDLQPDAPFPDEHHLQPVARGPVPG